MEAPSFLPDITNRSAPERAGSLSASSASSTATSPGMQPAADFLVTTDSLMNQAPPEPPSPYHPLAQKRIASVLPSLFQSKLETSKLRDRKLKQLREAEAFAEAELQKAQKPVKLTLGKNRRAASGDEGEPTEPTTSEQEPAAAKTVSAYDECIKEFHFLEAQRQQLCSEESDMRAEIVAEEELLYTRATLQHFESLAHAITASELSESEKARAEEILNEEDTQLSDAKNQRAEERRALLESIAASTSVRLAEERLRMRLQKAIGELLPEHEDGRNEIMVEEQDALMQALEWERTYRPMGPGCGFAGPAEDPRLRHRKAVKKGRHHKPTTTELAIEQLRRGKASDAQEGGPAANEGALVVYKTVTDEDGFADPPDTTLEVVFVEEGKQLYVHERDAKLEAIRKARALQDLLREEESTRADILLEESEDFLPILLSGVDGIYEARHAARARVKREGEAETEALADRIARMDAKSHILAGDFAGDPKAQKNVKDATWGGDFDAPDEDDRCSSLERHEDPAFKEDSAPLDNSNFNLTTDDITGDYASMLVNTGDLPSMDSASIQGALGVIVRSSFSPGKALLTMLTNPSDEESEEELVHVARSAVAAAKESATKYLRDELWLHDLLMPEATAALLATQDGIVGDGAQLLMDLASSRTDIVNEQIEAILDFCSVDLE